MYHHYFGLQEAPFSISVDPRYLFMSARHRDALAHLLYGVDVGGGFVLLTGEVGTGKTTIIRCLLDKLPHNIDVALVLNPALKSIELLATVCDELGIDYPQEEQSMKMLTDKLHQFLLSNHAKDRNTVLLIDEAQHLSFDVLEQIRLLTNLETNTKKLLQIILVGQPELRTLLSKPEFRQLAQRITARYQLKPLSLHETDAYIRHRLHVASLPGNQELFPPNVIIRLYKISRGVPRLINVLCDRMLLGTYAQHKTIVDMAILKQAANEVLGEDDETDASMLKSRVLNPFRIAQRFFTNKSLGSNFSEDELDPTPTPRAGLIISIAIIIVAVGSLLWWQRPEQSQPIVTVPTKNLNSNNDNAHNEPWSTNKQQALDELLAIQALTDVAPKDLCHKKITNTTRDKSLTSKLMCEQQSVETWQELKEFNRQSVLTLITSSRQKMYATLIAIDDNQALLSHNGGKQTLLPLLQLGKIWTGEFLFIWRAAPHFTRPVGLNDNGPIVKWLANQFAVIDGQQTLLANTTFNIALKQRVKLFQDEHNLEADGLVGLKTLLKINEALGISKTLVTAIDTNDSSSQSLKTQKNTLDFSQAREG